MGDLSEPTIGEPGFSYEQDRLGPVNSPSCSPIELWDEERSVTMFGANNQRLNRLHEITKTCNTAMARESNDRGASMVEYGLLLVFVLLAAFLSIQVFGETLVALFDTSASTLDNAPGVHSEG